MPMKSQAQRAYLHANEPEVAEEFEKHTPKSKKLPRKVTKNPLQQWAKKGSGR